jgi:biofilm PGA synthesis N-glycosyltransferase PgaC
MGLAPQPEGMSRPGLSYALVTAARNEADNLGRLAASLQVQTVLPGAWIIVENGSTDATLATARALAAAQPWIHVVSLPEPGGVARGGAIVRAFLAGIDALPAAFDVIVNLDADVSMEPDYFERLLIAFDADPELGIASGSCWELDGAEWRQRFVTRSGAWGASRAYRRACLAAVSPLEQRHGWDGIDELRAQVAGWSTRTLVDLPFFHHRPEGVRDGGKRAAWSAEGRLAHYMGYRFSYLLARTLYRAAAQRDPSALAMVGAYVAAAARREPRCADRAAVTYLRDSQRTRALPLRAREAFGRRTA